MKNTNNDLLSISRIEKKYMLSKIEASKVNHLFSNVLKSDIHNIGDGYTVRSLYFDSFDDSDYYDKENGYNYRKKIRLRIYSSDSETAKLEKKEKWGIHQWKRSLTISKSDAEKLILGDFSPLLNYSSTFAFELYEIMTLGLYSPKCIVEYERNAFIVDENEIRLTLDSNIRATETCYDLFSKDLNLSPVCDLDNVTFEVKYNGFLLSYVKDLISSCNKRPTSNSKYIMGRSSSRFNIDGYI